VRHYLLDTSALLTLRDDEAGAEQVAEILALAQRGEARVSGCFITLNGGVVPGLVWKPPQA
jgi:PIN domain nuclease of toxin-antitoxin system